MHALSRDPTLPGAARARARRRNDGLDIQRYYLEQVEAQAGDALHASVDRDGVLPYWRAMLDRLESAPGSVATTLDWAIKRVLFRPFSRDSVGRMIDSCRDMPF